MILDHTISDLQNINASFPAQLHLAPLIPLRRPLLGTAVGDAQMLWADIQFVFWLWVTHTGWPSMLETIVC